MKVLFVCSGNSHYGVIPFIKSQGDSLVKEGVDLEYFLVKSKGIMGYLKNVFLLKKEIEIGKFDIIHAHYGLMGLLCILTLTRKPLVLSVMGSDAYGSFNKDGKRKLGSYIPMFLTQVALFFSDWIIVKSKNIFNIVPYSQKTSIIPNGVDFTCFQPVENNLVSKKILWLADKSNARKNFKLINDAFGLLPYKYKDVELITPYPIEQKEFPEYLNRSAVFVLTSYNEGSPNVIKEAMACNIPIVSTNVGDVNEVIGKTKGCFITSFDPNDVTEKMILALEYEKKTTGREDIKHLESGLVAKKIIDIYKTLIIKKGQI